MSELPRTRSRGRENARKPGAGSRSVSTSVDDYLARLPADARSALQSLRRTIRSAAPGATEVISYRVPTFRLHGGLVAFAAFEDHLSLFVMSPAVMEAHRGDLEGYDTAKATVHFTSDAPLPSSLVKKLVRARIVENKARSKR